MPSKAATPTPPASTSAKPSTGWPCPRVATRNPCAVSAPAPPTSTPSPTGSCLLQHGSAYVQQSLDAYEAPYRERKATTMAKQAKALGYTLVPLAAQG